MKNSGLLSTRKQKLSALKIVLCLSAVALAPVFWNIYWRVPGQLDFFLHRAQYEEIVQVAKSKPPPIDERPGHFTQDGITSYYIRGPKGQYTITLVTADWGHIGMAGYLYSDLPPARRDEPYSNVDAPGDLWMLEGKVAPHWWIISNHLK